MSGRSGAEVVMALPNGPDGTTRVGNATVTLNGTDILTQSDIDTDIAAVERAAIR